MISIWGKFLPFWGAQGVVWLKFIIFNDLNTPTWQKKFPTLLI